MPSGSDELGSTYVRSEPHATRRAAKEAVSRPDRYPAVESHLPNRLKGIAIVTIFAGELICVGPAGTAGLLDGCTGKLYAVCWKREVWLSRPHIRICGNGWLRFWTKLPMIGRWSL